MRKYRHLVLAAASVIVLGVPAGAAYAASAHPATAKPVLTIGKKGGPAVKRGAVLKASLARRTSVSFTLGAFSAKCTSSKLTAKVTRNPSRPGKATLSVTGETVSRCKLSTTLATLQSITAVNLPYSATVSNAKGDPVSISGSRKSKPVGFKAVITFGRMKLTCVYTAKAVSGHASNTGNKVSFRAQKLTLNTKSSSSLCSSAAKTATFSATYGPVRDTSVRHNPKVFIS
jgi:hypothetical protein